MLGFDHILTGDRSRRTGSVSTFLDSLLLYYELFGYGWEHEYIYIYTRIINNNNDDNNNNIHTYIYI